MAGREGTLSRCDGGVAAGGVSAVGVGRPLRCATVMWPALPCPRVSVAVLDLYTYSTSTDNETKSLPLRRRRTVGALCNSCTYDTHEHLYRSPHNEHGTEAARSISRSSAINGRCHTTTRRAAGTNEMMD